MRTITSLLSVTTLAATLLAAAPAVAGPSKGGVIRDHRSQDEPVVRDHRKAEPKPAPTPAPTIRDHRTPAATESTASAHAPRDHRRHETSATVSIEHAPRHHRRGRGPRLMMPLKIDLGAAGANTSRGFAPGIGAAIGIHWASLAPRPTDTDVGIGVFGALLAAPEDATGMNDSNGVDYAGAYLEVGRTLARGRFARVWASARGEYLASFAFGDSHTGFGATGRLSAELYASGGGLAPRGLFLGTYAIGVYAEVGARDVVSDLGALHAGGGLTFRTPLRFYR